MIKNVSFLALAILFLFAPVSFAAEEKWATGEFRLKYEYQHFVIDDIKAYTYTAKEYISEKETPEEEVLSPESTEFCTDRKKLEKNTKTKKLQYVKHINTEKLEQYLQNTIAPDIDQTVNNVRIFKDKSGKIEFEGYAQQGRKLNIQKSIQMIEYAITNDINIVTLAVDEITPTVTVDNAELQQQGIIELIATGRSDFYPSSEKRIQNIMAGANTFNGHIVKKDEIFSFNTLLGNIDASNGYAKEYVILGNRVSKEYGGGLCQVSSTAYRGVMLAGLKIVKRHHHSFAVSHYKPHGSDATIYQGVKDFKWQNDSPADILIQTRKGGKRGSELFFYYYGTSPQRDVKIFGPTFKNFKTPPKNKVTYSSSLPAGTHQNASSRVAGFDATFGRTVLDNGEDLHADTFLSRYQARGNWVIRGGSAPARSSKEITRAE